MLATFPLTLKRPLSSPVGAFIMAGPDTSFWQARFEQQQTAWDRGGPSPQLMHWLATGEIPAGRVAVPGCGHGWEVAELARQGREVVALDYTPAAVQSTQHRLQAQHLSADVVQADVLQYEPSAPFDAVYEQTCLCAIHPEHWATYAAQLHRWLRPEGRLLMLIMQRPRPAAIDEGLIEGPPYHCDINAIRALFPERLWHWPKPPYPKVVHPSLSHELAVVLHKR